MRAGIDILLFALLSLITAYALYRLLLFNRQLYRKKNEHEIVLADLENALGFSREGLPLSFAIEFVGEQETNAEARSQLYKELAQHKFGISYLTKEELENRLKLYAEKEERARSDAEGFIQAYSTLSMFVAAVAPAFIIFAFVGSQVLESTHVSAWLFSSLLLLFLPFVFALVITIMNRRVYEVPE